MKIHIKFFIISSVACLLFLALFFSAKSFAYFEDMFEDSGSSTEDFSDEPSAENQMEYVTGTIYCEGEFLDGDLLKISVFSEDISAPVLGIAFHFIYENEKLSFLKYDPGDFLELGGDPFYLVKDFKTEGKIIFGETLRQDDNFPVGSGKIADIYFQINDDKDFSFEFKNGVVSSVDSVRQDMANIEWKKLDLVKNGFFDFSNMEVSVLGEKIDFGFAGILFALISFSGLFVLCFHLYKKFRKHQKRVVFFPNN